MTPLVRSREEKGISPLGRTPLLGEDALAMTPGPPATRTRRVSGLGYLPALDGLRAVAVAAVLLYHADLGWFSGRVTRAGGLFLLQGTTCAPPTLATTTRPGRDA